MKVRCPTCGAVMSLDVLIAHDDVSPRRKGFKF